MTGATGHIGSIFTHGLLRKYPRPNQLTLLVRGTSEGHSRSRLQAAIERIDDANRRVKRSIVPPDLSGVKVVPFDLASLHDPHQHEKLASLLSPHGPFTHTMHLAANTSYYASVKASGDMNIHGATGLLHAVSKVSGEALKRFCYVSTAWACGKRHTVGSVLQEADYPLPESHETMEAHFYP